VMGTQPTKIIVMGIIFSLTCRINISIHLYSCTMAKILLLIGLGYANIIMMIGHHNPHHLI